MKRIYFFILLFSSLLFCCNEEGATTKVAIYEVAGSINTWCFYLQGQVYNDFRDTTLYVDDEGVLRSRFRPALQGVRHSTLVLNESYKSHFDSIIFSSYCIGRYGMTIDATITHDTCWAIVLHPDEWIGCYSFILTDEESLLINALFSDLPCNNYIKPPTEQHCPHCTLVRRYQDNHTCTSFLDMSADSIPQNLAICSEAIESIVSWHINNDNYVNRNIFNNKNRAIFDNILMENGMPPSMPTTPPPSIPIETSSHVF